MTVRCTSSGAWKAVRLEEVCNRITDGTHQPPKFQNEGVPFLVINNIVDGVIDWARVSKWVSRETYEDLTRRCPIERGDVLYTAVGSYGTAVAVDTDTPFLFQRHIAHIKPKSGLVDSKYLVYALNSPNLRATADRVARGVAQKTVTLGDLRDFMIPLPALGEQRRIVAILDIADSIRRKRNETLALAQQLQRAAFLDMFGDPITNPRAWPTRSVRDMCESTQYGTAERSNDLGRGAPMLRMNNLTYEGRLDLSELKHVALPAEELRRFDLRDGDVLFNRTNSLGLVGKTAVWSMGPGYTFAGYLIRLRPRTDLALGVYMAAALNTASAKRLLMATAKPSINMANISASDLSRISIAVPPIKLQHVYAQLVSGVDGLRSRAEAGIQNGEQLMQSLVDRAFRGELTAATAEKQLALFAPSP